MILSTLSWLVTGVEIPIKIVIINTIQYCQYKTNSTASQTTRVTPVTAKTSSQPVFGPVTFLTRADGCIVAELVGNHIRLWHYIQEPASVLPQFGPSTSQNSKREIPLIQAKVPVAHQKPKCLNNQIWALLLKLLEGTVKRGPCEFQPQKFFSPIDFKPFAKPSPLNAAPTRTTRHAQHKKRRRYSAANLREGLLEIFPQL